MIKTEFWLIASVILFAVVFLSGYSIWHTKEQKKKARLESAKAEFLENYKAFKGYFSPLSTAISSKDPELAKKMLLSWRKYSQPFSNLHNFLCTDIQGEDIEAAQKLLVFLESCSIFHDMPGDTISATDEACRLYLFDDIFEDGELAKVLYPSWWLEREGRKIVIERGAASIIESEDIK